MQGNDYNIETKEQEASFQKFENIHPHKMLLYLGMLGSILIFFFMVGSYTISKPSAEFFSNFNFPKAFVLSTVFLMLSSYTMTLAKRSLEQADFKSLRNNMGLTLILAAGFTLCQYLGWKQLDSYGIYLSGESSGAYLYVISGLHVFHIGLGMLVLSFAFLQVQKAAKDPVKALIMETNPYDKIKLDMLTSYWHFINIIWGILFFYFLFTF